MFQISIDALLRVLSLEGLFFVTIGAIIGTIAGILPGLGGMTAIILILPFLWKLEPIYAVMLLLSAHSSVTFGGSITSIILNTPAASNVFICTVVAP